MSQIMESVDVSVPVTTAYNQWTEFESFPDFLDEVDEIIQLDDTHQHWRVSIGGAAREFDAEITEQHSDERIAWTSVGGETANAGVVTFHKLSDDTSRVTVQIEWEPDGVVEQAGAKLGVASHAVKKDLENFKQLIESRGTATGEWRGDIPR